MNNNHLSAELNAALEAQRNHIATMGQSFSQENMTIYTQLQERVRVAQLAVSSAENGPTAATPAAATSVGTAYVHLIRAGKASKTVEVPATATLRAVLDSVGWSPSEMTFQLRQNGTSIDVTNLDSPLGEGTSEYLCNPKYAAGVRV